MQPYDELYDTSNEEFYSRNPFQWDRRNEDMDIWSKPPEYRKVAASSDSGSEGPMTSQKTQLRVTMPRVEGSRAHRCAVETEMIERGRYASNQLDRLRDILKDPPRRHILRCVAATVPALSVVHYPSVDTAARAAGLEMSPSPQISNINPKGFRPGTGRGVRLTARGNAFSIADYEREKFAEVRGQDFK